MNMHPTDALKLRAPTLLAADTTTLAEATFLHVRPIAAPFTPSEVQDVGDLTFSLNDAGDAKVTTSAVHSVARDPATGDYIITIAEPAGGWNWVSDATDLPVTFYGLAVMDVTEADLYGVNLFFNDDGTPKTYEITAAGMLMAEGFVRFRFPYNYMLS